jgi:HlyD family secretion protein
LDNPALPLNLYLWGGAILLVVILLSGSVYAWSRFRGREPYTGPTWKVSKQILKVTIVERGTLESAENSDIICRVKAGTKGSSFASTIKWVIEDGTHVKEGDRLVELDDSGFQEQLKDWKNKVNEAYAKWIDAKTNLIIVEAQNESEIKSAEVSRNLATVDLTKFVGSRAGARLLPLETHDQVQKYLTSTFQKDVADESKTADNKLTSEYLQALNEIEGRIEIARSDREMWADRAAWSQGMVTRGYYTRSQSEADLSRKASAEIALRKVQGESDVYRRFILERTVTDLWGKVKESERKLATVIKQAEPKMEKARADEMTRKAIYDQEVDRLAKLEREEKDYRIDSPQEGMVVYYMAEQSRSGSGSQQSIIAQGETVREGQKLLRIPNLNKMMVNARVHEAMVSKIRGEYWKPTLYGEGLRATMSFGRSDLIALATYHFAFDEKREKFKEREKEVLFQGHAAAIRVDAFPGKQYKGHVRTVATIASQAEFFSSDVKVYQSMVSIDDLDERGLKPGMSAEVTIFADETKEPVLVMPIQSVVGNVAMGEKRKCYVLDAAGYPQTRDIVVGKSNDKMVEILDGVKEDETVVLNPRALIPEKSDMKPGTPSSRRGAEMEEGKGGGKAGKGGKGKKGGGGEGVPQGVPNDQKAFQGGGGNQPGPADRKKN